MADFITRGLRAEGWIAEHAGSGEAALEILSQHEFDIVLLDLMLPGISGQDVCRKMRARGNHTPVLMLSALDYLAKPFDFDELIARVEALRRRENDFKSSGDSEVLQYEALSLNTRSLVVTVDNKEIELTAKERDLLLLLMANRGKVFARERILNTVWGSQEDPLTNVIDVYIGRLRKKLGDSGKHIRTIRGLGYRFGE